MLWFTQIQLVFLGLIGSLLVYVFVKLVKKFVKNRDGK